VGGVDAPVVDTFQHGAAMKHHGTDLSMAREVGRVD
jgi:hypothetical protein